MTQSDNNASAQGVQALIDTLREQGVEAGRQESTRLVEEAEHRTSWMVEQAEEEARQIIKKANNEADFIRSAGREALQIAFRDIKLKLKDELAAQFALQLKNLVQHELQQPDTLKQMLLYAAQQTELPNEPIAALLPQQILGLDELRKHPESLQQGPLLEILSDVTHKLLQRGIELQGHSQAKAGITYSLRNGEICVELTDDVLTELLLKHLQPRFRALLEGVVA